VLGFLATMLARAANAWPRQRQASVRADAAGLHVDGALRMPRASIARGYLQPLARQHPVVHLEGKGKTRSIDVVVSDAAEGTRILEVLGLDASHRAVSFRGSSPIDATFARQGLVALSFVVLIGMQVALAQLAGAWALAIFPLLVVPLAAAMLGSTITVGADGVLTRWMGLERFYPYEEFPDVMPHENGVTLLGRSGQAVTIATSPARRRELPQPAMTRAAVQERIEEAQRAFAEHRGIHAAALVARSGREMSDWLGALRSLAASADYREAAVPREALWRIAEDPAADPTARAGAAVALRARIDEADRARLRVAAESSVSPKLRVALEAAASEGDDAEVQAALEALGES
jgi:hypothetical protein